ncbi:AbrB family transcriptional regulator [Chthonobacter rhizosphaerae]|uniref:AbrB family transcriptional regulator n=1 Tax=Chthonobacter rhizosphaerae TaxID=2735553 RepID=UPI0015EE5183|nr:AbrB family transcriptional regulator [Chthonobacter rhizosphaerae]
MTARSPMPPRALGALALVFAIGAAGGAAFAALGLPAAWLSGAMVATGVAALLGLDAKVPARLRDLVYMVLGVSMGAGVTPDILNRMGSWPISLVGLVGTVAAVTLATYGFLRKVAGWDPATAYFGSIPGALSMTLATAEVSKADMRKVALSQSMRLFMLVAVLPGLVTSFEAPVGASSAGAVVTGLVPLVLLAVAGAVGSVLATLARMPAGVLIGAFVASSLLHGVGLVEGQLPAAIQLPAFVALGAFLGLRFAGTSLRLVIGTIVTGVGAFAVAFAASLAGAVIVAELADIGLGQVLVAFAPGGLEAMVILAFVLGVDPAFVAAHHLARFVGMTIVVPLFARFVLGPDWDQTTARSVGGRRT